MLLIVPELLPVLLRRRGGDAQAGRVLRRFDVPVTDRTVVWGDSTNKRRVPLVALFAPEFRRTTLLLSAIGITHLIVVYFLSNWLPILSRQSGASSGGALNLTAFFNFGGIAGVLLMGWLIDLAGLRRVLTSLFLTGSFALLWLALSGPAARSSLPHWRSRDWLCWAAPACLMPCHRYSIPQRCARQAAAGRSEPGIWDPVPAASTRSVTYCSRKVPLQ